MRYLAHHDVLSGALNRTSFDEALQGAVWQRAEGGNCAEPSTGRMHFR